MHITKHKFCALLVQVHQVMLCQVQFLPLLLPAAAHPFNKVGEGTAPAAQQEAEQLHSGVIQGPGIFHVHWISNKVIRIHHL